jgi:hypothetical protein
MPEGPLHLIRAPKLPVGIRPKPVSVLGPPIFLPAMWPKEKHHGTFTIRSASRDRRAWNAGRAVGAKRALRQRQIWEIPADGHLPSFGIGQAANLC